MKIMATVHQVQLTNKQVNHLNRVGREQAHKDDPRFKAYDDIKFTGFKPEYWTFYSEQGCIEVETDISAEIGVARMLENIYSAGNDGGYGPWAERYTRYPTAFSCSLGDIIIIGESAWVVASQGFDKVELPHARGQGAQPERGFVHSICSGLPE